MSHDVTGICRNNGRFGRPKIIPEQTQILLASDRKN